MTGMQADNAAYQFSAEYIAFIVLLLLSAHSVSRGKTKLRQQHIFLICIGINLLSIIIDFVSVCVLANAQSLPMWVVYAVNALYFLSCFAMTSAYFSYLLGHLMSHIHNKTPHMIVHVMIWLSNIVLVLMTLLNAKTGMLFYFDADRTYCRGQFWYAGYVQVILLMTVVVLVMLCNWQQIDRGGRNMISLGIPIVMLIVLYQLLYPEMLLNGIVGAFAAFLFYLNFESRNVDTDTVTRLPNLNAFMQNAERMRREKQSYQMILVSLRDFGAFNSAHGFYLGNEALYVISAWLEHFFHDGNLYRFGSAVFAGVVPYESEPLADKKIQTLIQTFPQEWKLRDRVYRIDSYFADCLAEPTMRPSEIVEQIEYTRGQCKRGGIRYLRLNEQMIAEMNRRKYLFDYLQQAVDRKLFQMWYQPIYCVKTGTYTAAEALIRLRDDSGKFLSPEEFVTLAEENGIMAAIGSMTIQQVYAFLAEIPKIPIPQIAFNLSACMLRSSDFSKTLAELQHKYQIPKEQVTFEVTERIFMEHDLELQEALRQMQQAGCQFLLDDFGTGFSNFSTTMLFPFSKIKLDKSLIWNSELEKFDTVRTLVDLFHRAGKLVVAEGIETKEQADRLIEMGVDFLQGYYFQRPMSPEQFRSFILGT